MPQIPAIAAHRADRIEPARQIVPQLRQIVGLGITPGQADNRDR
jgi:hypothetical protein